MPIRVFTFYHIYLYVNLCYFGFLSRVIPFLGPLNNVVGNLIVQSVNVGVCMVHATQ